MDRTETLTAVDIQNRSTGTVTENKLICRKCFTICDFNRSLREFIKNQTLTNQKKESAVVFVIFGVTLPRFC